MAENEPHFGGTATVEREWHDDEEAVSADIEFDPDDPENPEVLAELAKEFDFEDDSSSGAHENLYKNGELYSVKTDDEGNKKLVPHSEELTGEALTQYRDAMSTLNGGESTHTTEFRWPASDTETQEAYSVVTYELLDNGRVQTSFSLELRDREEILAESDDADDDIFDTSSATIPNLQEPSTIPTYAPVTYYTSPQPLAENSSPQPSALKPETAATEAKPETAATESKKPAVNPETKPEQAPEPEPPVAKTPEPRRWWQPKPEVKATKPEVKPAAMEKKTDQPAPAPKKPETPKHESKSEPKPKPEPKEIKNEKPKDDDVDELKESPVLKTKQTTKPPKPDSPKDSPEPTGGRSVAPERATSAPDKNDETEPKVVEQTEQAAPQAIEQPQAAPIEATTEAPAEIPAEVPAELPIAESTPAEVTTEMPIEIPVAEATSIEEPVEAHSAEQAVEVADSTPQSEVAESIQALDVEETPTLIDDDETAPEATTSVQSSPVATQVSTPAPVQHPAQPQPVAESRRPEETTIADETTPQVAYTPARPVAHSVPVAAPSAAHSDDSAHEVHEDGIQVTANLSERSDEPRRVARKNTAHLTVAPQTVAPRTQVTESPSYVVVPEPIKEAPFSVEPPETPPVEQPLEVQTAVATPEEVTTVQDRPVAAQIETTAPIQTIERTQPAQSAPPVRESRRPEETTLIDEPTLLTNTAARPIAHAVPIAAPPATLSDDSTHEFHDDGIQVTANLSEQPDERRRIVSKNTAHMTVTPQTVAPRPKEAPIAIEEPTPLYSVPVAPRSVNSTPIREIPRPEPVQESYKKVEKVSQQSSMTPTEPKAVEAPTPVAPIIEVPVAPTLPQVSYAKNETESQKSPRTTDVDEREVPVIESQPSDGGVEESVKPGAKHKPLPEVLSWADDFGATEAPTIDDWYVKANTETPSTISEAFARPTGTNFATDSTDDDGITINFNTDGRRNVSRRHSSAGSTTA